MRRKGNCRKPGSANGPAVPRAPWASPLAIPVGFWVPFFSFIFWGDLRWRAKAMIFHAQSRARGVWSSKGAAQCPQMDPLDARIAGLVKRSTFVQTPRSGSGAARPPPQGKIWVVKAALLSQLEAECAIT